MSKRQPLTDEELTALRAYAATHGRYWKAQLREAWMTASEPGILQALRNAAHFGPGGLIAFRLRADGRG
jgi:plasmid stability protein